MRIPRSVSIYERYISRVGNLFPTAPYFVKSFYSFIYARLTLDNGKITQSELLLNAEVDGISSEEFEKIAREAERTCPVSAVVSFEIILNINLKK